MGKSTGDQLLEPLVDLRDSSVVDGFDSYSWRVTNAEVSGGGAVLQLFSDSCTAACPHVK